MTRIGAIKEAKTSQTTLAPEKKSESHHIVHVRIKKIAVAVLLVLGTALAACTVVSSVLAALCVVHVTVAIGAASACAAVACIALWGKMTPHLPPRLKRLSQLVQALVSELCAAFIIKLLFPLNLERFDPKKGDPNIKQTEVPVLFIHGFLGASGNWVYHRRRLQEAECKNLFTINLGNPLISIGEYAEKVRTKLQDICDITGRKDVIIIGHSMGGLVAREFLYKHNTEGIKVRKLITLGTPLQGTKIARLASWISKCAQEMLPGSNTIKDLEAHERKDKKTRFYRIASRGDFTIYPRESAEGQLPQKGQYVTIADLEATGHVGELLSDTIGNILVDEVKQEQAEAQTEILVA